MHLLAIIGLVFLLYFAAKFFTNIGKGLELISKRMEDRTLTAVSLKREQDKKRLERERQKIQAIRDEDYLTKVRGEIDHLTE